jgi:iron complex outermembrane receptor protein
MAGAAYAVLGVFTAGSARAAPADAAVSSQAAANSVVVDTVVVTGNAKKSPVQRVVATGALGARSVLDTPFSVQAVTSDEIKELQVKDINGVFRNDPSVTEVNSSVAQASGAIFRIRGVALDQLNSYKLDGLAVPYWSIDFPIEQFQQVQLFKGATGYMYGFGSPAGIVNFVSKRPTDQQTLALDLGYRSDNLFGGDVDVGGRTAGGRIGYRATVLGEAGHTFNGGYNSNYSGALALDARLTDRLTWTADAFYMKTYQAGEVNTVAVTNAVTHLEPVDGRTNFGAIGAWKTNEMNVFTTGLNWDIDGNWKATASYRHSKLDENFPGNLVYISSNAGAYKDYAFFVQRLFVFDQGQATVQGHFATGPLTHEVVLGVEDLEQKFYSDAQSLTLHAVGTGNIYTSPRPTLGAYPASKYVPRLYLINSYSQQSVFGADTIGWGDFSLLAGARYTIYRDTTRGPTNAVTAVYKYHPLTPTVALTYSLQPRTKLYVSYVEGLQNGGQAGASNVNYGETFGPIQTQQVEVVLKTDQRAWSATLAAFWVEQGAGYTNTANYYVQDGKVRYQGVEAAATVRPTPQWVLGASASYTDATYVQSAPAFVGKTVPGVPRVQAALSVRYLVPQLPGLSGDVAVKYAGEGYGNTANTLAFPSHTTVDLGAGYVTTIGGRRVGFHAAVKNVGDARYWVYGATTVIPAEPRTFAVSTHLDF